MGGLGQVAQEARDTSLSEDGNASFRSISATSSRSLHLFAMATCLFTSTSRASRRSFSLASFS